MTSLSHLEEIYNLLSTTELLNCYSLMYFFNSYILPVSTVESMSNLECDNVIQRQWIYKSHGYTLQ